MRHSDRTLRTGLTAAALAALIAVAVVCVRTTFDLPHNGPPQGRATATGPVAPAPAPDTEVATAEPPAPPGVEVVPEAESPPPITIRQSAGHAAGLNKVKDPLRLSASAAYAIDADTGQVLVQKNEDAILPIASLTKMMTGLLTVEAKLPMDEVITITQEDVDTELHSRSRLRVGTTLTRVEALHLALMSSENRAAHALGRTFPGGLAQFVNAMNTRARQLGMKSTTYVEPTGLSHQNQSTAHDLALLALTASRQPLLREFTTTKSLQVAFGGRKLLYNNSNRLVKNPKWDVEFQKTGYIIEAGMCMTVKSRMGGHDVVMVLLDSGDKRSRLDDAERVKRWVGAQSGGNDTLADGRTTPRHS
ncbi:peptidase S11 [Ramlibacter sp. G-1-2-2]|uniref:Peptidase S11 n=1 Tax=Ramlibacter agri TaxID=2728837 RepID=A0A848HGM3_9BURK|nr:serine hydrolase [Ramlibacter agri]NML48579.1 peptidase S11 [Ramlibacter agri]